MGTRKTSMFSHHHSQNFYVQPAPLAKRLSCAMGTHNVVDHINLSIVRGEIVCLLGPSGCDKTTMMRMIGGFIEPDSGLIIIDGAYIPDGVTAFKGADDVEDAKLFIE